MYILRDKYNKLYWNDEHSWIKDIENARVFTSEEIKSYRSMIYHSYWMKLYV